MNRRALRILAATAALATLPSITSQLGAQLEEVQGVVGLSGFESTAYLAIHVPVPEGHALASIAWYNNDAAAVFPRLLVASGLPAGPGSIQDAFAVADGVVGGTSAWSTVEFSEPIGSLNPGLYLVFEFPEGLMYSGPGAGGGPAVGYWAGTGLDGGGWISGDGEEWHPLAPDYRFAIEPTVVPVEGGTTMLRQPVGAGATAVVAEPFLLVSPNPANPQFIVRFGLSVAGPATLDVHDVRGRLVVRLVGETLAAGRHQLVWTGRDAHGQNVASGVYFLRLRLPTRALTSRVTLLR